MNYFQFIKDTIVLGILGLAAAVAFCWAVGFVKAALADFRKWRNRR